MRTEHGFGTPLSNFLYAFTDLLNNMAGMARMQTLEIAKRSGYEGTVEAKPAPVVMTVIEDAVGFCKQLDIVKGSAAEIPGLVDCVCKIVGDFHTKASAATANCDDKTSNVQEVCANITDARWNAEQALCKLNEKVAELHVASHAVFAGVELRLCCPPHECVDRWTYVSKAAGPDNKQHQAKGKPGA